MFLIYISPILFRVLPCSTIYPQFLYWLNPCVLSESLEVNNLPRDARKAFSLEALVPSTQVMHNIIGVTVGSPCYKRWGDPYEQYGTTEWCESIITKRQSSSKCYIKTYQLSNLLQYKLLCSLKVNGFFIGNFQLYSPSLNIILSIHHESACLPLLVLIWVSVLYFWSTKAYRN